VKLFNKIVFLLCLAVAMFDVGTASAASMLVKPDVVLKKAFPDLSFDKINETDINGLYEVVTGQNVLYFYPEKEYLFIGEIYNKDKKPLSAETKRQLREQATKLVKDLPLEKAVKIGSGKNTVIEFTDPDCPYCRKASEFLKKQKDLTRYIFFAPFAHPQAITKIHYILNAKDKGAAYEEMMSGKPAPQRAEYPDSIKALAQEHIAQARKVGVQGTPTFFVNGQEVVGADEKRLSELLRNGGK
jgi:thiol:disulfide interchange protein DsbC